jgi:dTDP-4-amino-4,6-dideoxygalactose transaminase
MPDLTAAYGLGQLEEIDKRYALRAKIHQRYKDLLGDAYISEAHSWMCIYRNTKERTEFIIERLEQNGIIAKQYYLPIHWNQSFNTCGDHFPGAEKAWRELIYLPSSLNLTQEQIYRISTIINEI